MKKLKSISPYLFVILLVLVSCKEVKQKEKSETTIEQEGKSEPAIKTVNISTIVKEDNIYVINQTFSKQNNQKSVEGNPVEVDLSPTSGAMISAYSEYKEEYTIFLKTLDNNIWSDWIELKENDHVENPNRKVLGPLHLKNSVKQIQFKSNKVTKSEVIFRVFTFEK